MKMEIPSFCLDCNVQQEKDWLECRKNRSKKKDKLIKVCPFVFIK